MFDCIVDCFSLFDDLVFKWKIIDLEKLLNCVFNKLVVDYEIRVEIVYFVVSCMGRVVYVCCLLMGWVR